MLAMFRRGLFYNFLAIYLRHFLGLSVTATTLFATFPMIVNVAAQRYLWGALSDKYQKRRSLIVWGEILAGAGTILLWYCHRIPADNIQAGWVLIWGLTLIEVFWSMSNIGWSALISDLYAQGNRSSIMGRLESLGGIGRIIGILSGGLLYDRMGTEFAGWGFYNGSLFWISGIIMFISVFPMFLVPEGGIRNMAQGGEVRRETTETDSRIFFVYILALACIHFGRNSVAVTLPQYLSLEPGLNLSALTLSHVMNIRSLGLIFTGLMAGRLCQRAGDRAMLVLSSGTAVLALLIFGLSDSLAHICVSSFLMGFSEVIILAASYELASSYIPPEKRGRLFAVFNATFFLSWGMAGTLIAGPIIDSLINLGKPHPFAYKMSFLASAGITLLGVFILLGLFRMEKRAGTG